MLKLSSTIPRLSRALPKPAFTRAFTRLSLSKPQVLSCRQTLSQRATLTRRWYTHQPKLTPSPETDSTEQKPAPNPEAQTLDSIPSEKFVEVLEKTAGAPWLAETPLDPETRLKRAYTLLFQVILYLGRPQEPEAAQQFLIAFESAPVSPTSEIARARRATSKILKAIVKDLSTIPLTSPIRTANAGLFAVFGALEPMVDVMTSPEGEVEDWRTFWVRAQPVVLQLVTKLDEDGFGFRMEDLQEK